MAVRKFPCVYMRGGTSKAVFFHKEDLPEEPKAWDEIFLKVMGTPDVKQIDGMGGTVSSTSKVAIIAKSTRLDADVDYTFCQVDIKQPTLGWNANCGNISSAVGPYAIDEGLVEAVEPITTRTRKKSSKNMSASRMVTPMSMVTLPSKGFRERDPQSICTSWILPVRQRENSCPRAVRGIPLMCRTMALSK